MNPDNSKSANKVGLIDRRHGDIDAQQIANFLGSDVVRISGALNRRVDRLASLDGALAGALIFCRHVDHRLERAVNSAASAALIPSNTASEYVARGPTLIAVSNPRLAFIKIMRWLFQARLVPYRHPTAIIHETAEVADTASIGAFAMVGPRCSIGHASVLGTHVVLQQDVHIGSHTNVDAGTIVGSEGFGFERDDSGTLVNFPHIGGVRIGDNVDIGSNVCIDRGTLEDTVIGDGARIDNLTHISHNCRIGAHAVVVCQVSMCGNTRLGDYAWVSPSASVLNQITIGDRAMVGMGAVVIRNVAPGEVVVGNPARARPQVSR